jgi:hypothetical protein
VRQKGKPGKGILGWVLAKKRGGVNMKLPLNELIMKREKINMLKEHKVVKESPHYSDIEALLKEIEEVDSGNDDAITELDELASGVLDYNTTGCT